MRQGTVLEAVEHTLATNNLLTDDSNHLRHVNKRTLGTASCHGQRCVVDAEFLETGITTLLTDLGQNTGHLVLHGHFFVTTSITHQLASLELLDESGNALLTVLDGENHHCFIAVVC